MIFSLIALVILIYALVDYKRAFMIYLVYIMFVDVNVSLILPGIPKLFTLQFVMLYSFVALFYLNRDKMKLETVKFPLKIPFIYLSISWLISSLFSLSGFHPLSYIYAIADKTILIWMIWCIVTDKEDILFLLKWFTIAFLISALYAYFEKSIEQNLLFDYKISLAKGEGYDSRYDSDFHLAHRGYRAQSVFSHAMGAGVNWGLYIVMALIMIIKYNWRNNRLALITVVLSIPCVFFTNGRSCLVFLFISCLSFVDFKNKRFKRLLILFGVAFVLVAPYLNSYFDLVNGLFNIFDSNASEDLVGSNLDMRTNQLTGVLGIWSQSPIFGFGPGFKSIMGGALVEAALGFESIWFETLATYGLIGFICNIILMYYSIIKIPMKYRSQPLLFISLAYWATWTITSIPGILTYFYYLILFMIIKLEIMSKQPKDTAANK